MKRTIEMKDGGYVFYRGKRIDWILSTLRTYFKLLRYGKFVVTIVEGTDYQIIPDPDQVVPGDTSTALYQIVVNGGTGYEDLFVCREHFDNLFFKPDNKKSYNITVKEVE